MSGCKSLVGVRGNYKSVDIYLLCYTGQRRLFTMEYTQSYLCTMLYPKTFIC